MPLGKTHDAATALLAGGAFLTLKLAGNPWSVVGMGTAGVAAGILLSPDMDLNEGYEGGSLLIRYTGLFGRFWVLLWKPYAFLIAHRSPLSHAPVLGTILRLAYLYGLYSILYFFYWIIVMMFGGHPAFFYVPALDIYWAELTGKLPLTLDVIQDGVFFFGLCLADTLHAVMDVLSTDLKRIVRRVFFQ